MSDVQTSANAPALPIGWRFKAGIVFFFLAMIPYSLLAPVIFHELPLGTLAKLVAGGVIFQKVVLITAVALLGKAGFAILKAKLFKSLAPPDEVGPARYRIGLIMFCLPLVQGLLETYGSHIAPDLVANRISVDIACDIMLFASLFVLGGNFWDKLRSLFVRQSRAVFLDSSAKTAGSTSLAAPAAH